MGSDALNKRGLARRVLGDGNGSRGSQTGTREGQIVLRLGWTLYLWPGVAQVLRRGSWAGLAAALGAALALNLALLGTFGWTELFAPAVRSGLWIFAGAIWLGLVALAAGWKTAPLGGQTPCDNGLFLAARDDYLKGNWFEAERGLRNALARDERDLECRLLLATLLRHTGRAEEAGQELDRLERLEGAARWAAEIAAERMRLRPAAAEAA